jgi:hypothetical protein
MAASTIVGKIVRQSVQRSALPLPTTGLAYGVIKGTILAIGFVIILSQMGIARTADCPRRRRPGRGPRAAGHARESLRRNAHPAREVRPGRRRAAPGVRPGGVRARHHLAHHAHPHAPEQHRGHPEQQARPERRDQLLAPRAAPHTAAARRCRLRRREIPRCSPTPPRGALRAGIQPDLARFHGELPGRRVRRPARRRGTPLPIVERGDLFPPSPAPSRATATS